VVIVVDCVEVLGYIEMFFSSYEVRAEFCFWSDCSLQGQFLSS
jgi:hypothetical protein